MITAGASWISDHITLYPKSSTHQFTVSVKKTLTLETENGSMLKTREREKFYKTWVSVRVFLTQPADSSKQNIHFPIHAGWLGVYFSELFLWIILLFMTFSNLIKESFFYVVFMQSFSSLLMSVLTYDVFLSELMNHYNYWFSLTFNISQCLWTSCRGKHSCFTFRKSWSYPSPAVSYCGIGYFVVSSVLPG
jgi:hypothetical protein